MTSHVFGEAVSAGTHTSKGDTRMNRSTALAMAVGLIASSAFTIHVAQAEGGGQD